MKEKYEQISNQADIEQKSSFEQGGPNGREKQDIEKIREIESRFNELGWGGYFEEAKEAGISQEVITVKPKKHIEELLKNGEDVIAHRAIKNFNKMGADIHFDREEYEQFDLECARRFMEQGRAHEIYDKIKKIASFLGLKAISRC